MKNTHHQQNVKNSYYATASCPAPAVMIKGRASKPQRTGFKSSSGAENTRKSFHHPVRRRKITGTRPRVSVCAVF